MGVQTRFVRLKPYDKRRGHLMRRYSVKRKRFMAGRWYEVPEGLARHLEGITSKPEDPMTPPAFDVVDTKAHAQRLMKREKMIRARATAENPELMTLTTRDLKGDEVREVDISDEDDVEQRPRRDPMRNTRMTDAEAIAALDDDSEPVRRHEIHEVPDKSEKPEPRARRSKPAPEKTAAAKKPAAKPAAKKPAAKKAKKARGKAKTTRAKAKAAKSSKGKAGTGMPTELDAAEWPEDEEQVDPFS